MRNDCYSDASSTALSFADATFDATTSVSFIVEDSNSAEIINISATDSESFLSGNVRNGYDFCGNRQYTVTTSSS